MGYAGVKEWTHSIKEQGSYAKSEGSEVGAASSGNVCGPENTLVTSFGNRVPAGLCLLCVILEYPNFRATLDQDRNSSAPATLAPTA